MRKKRGRGPSYRSWRMPSRLRNDLHLWVIKIAFSTCAEDAVFTIRQAAKSKKAKSKKGERKRQSDHLSGPVKKKNFFDAHFVVLVIGTERGRPGISG